MTKLITGIIVSIIGGGVYLFRIEILCRIFDFPMWMGRPDEWVNFFSMHGLAGDLYKIFTIGSLGLVGIGLIGVITGIVEMARAPDNPPAAPPPAIPQSGSSGPTQ